MTDESTTAAAYATRASGLAWRETGGEIVVLDLDGSVYFGLNKTATALWERLASGSTRLELMALLTELGADEERAGADVDDFVAALDAHGLLGVAGR